MFYIKDIVVKSCFFREGFLILELLSFHFPMPFHLLREERNVFCFFYLVFFFLMRYSQCFTSLSVLYTVYFVVRCCDFCGVLTYLFILFQLCRIYKEKKTSRKQSQPNPSVFLFLFTKAV